VDDAMFNVAEGEVDFGKLGEIWSARIVDSKVEHLKE
jgi:hypothetical protein